MFLSATFFYGTPLFVAGLMRLWLRKLMSPIGRIALLGLYSGLSFVWLWFWIRSMRRTRELELEEKVALAGIWAAPFLGALWLTLGIVVRRKNPSRGFEVLIRKDR